MVLLQAIPEPTYIGYGSIGALIIVVGMFLAALKFMIDKFMESHNKTVETISTVSENCHTFQENMTRKNGEIMEKVSSVLNANTTALAINTKAIEKSVKDNS